LQNYFGDADGDKLAYNLIRTNGTVVPLWLGMDIEYRITGAPSYHDNEIVNLFVEVDDGFGGNLTVPLVLNVNTHPLDT